MPDCTTFPGPPRKKKALSIPFSFKTHVEKVATSNLPPYRCLMYSVFCVIAVVTSLNHEYYMPKVQKIQGDCSRASRSSIAFQDTLQSSDFGRFAKLDIPIGSETQSNLLRLLLYEVRRRIYEKVLGGHFLHTKNIFDVNHLFTPVHLSNTLLPHRFD